MLIRFHDTGFTPLKAGWVIGIGDSNGDRVECNRRAWPHVKVLPPAMLQVEIWDMVVFRSSGVPISILNVVRLVFENKCLSQPKTFIRCRQQRRLPRLVDSSPQQAYGNSSRQVENGTVWT